jgi:uncharacterized membrane protein YgcG
VTLLAASNVSVAGALRAGLAALLQVQLEMVFLSGMYEGGSGRALPFLPADAVNAEGNDAAASAVANDTQDLLSVPSMSSTETARPAALSGAAARRALGAAPPLTVADALILPPFNASAPGAARARDGVVVWVNVFLGVVGVVSDARAAALAARVALALADPQLLAASTRPARTALAAALGADATLPEFAFDENSTFVGLASRINVYASAPAAAAIAAGGAAAGFAWVPVAAGVGALLLIAAAAAAAAAVLRRRRILRLVAPAPSAADALVKGPQPGGEAEEEEELAMDLRATARGVEAGSLSRRVARAGGGVGALFSEDVLADGRQLSGAAVDASNMQRRAPRVLPDSAEEVPVDATGRGLESTPSGRGGVGGGNGFDSGDGRSGGLNLAHDEPQPADNDGEPAGADSLGELLVARALLAKRESLLQFQRRMDAQNRAREAHFRELRESIEAKKKEREIAEVEGEPLMLRALRPRPAARPWWSSPVAKTVHLDIGEARVFKAHPDLRGTPEALAQFKRDHPGEFA